jgi:hypothetical protein
VRPDDSVGAERSDAGGDGVAQPAERDRRSGTEDGRDAVRDDAVIGGGQAEAGEGLVQALGVPSHGERLAVDNLERLEGSVADRQSVVEGREARLVAA